MKHKWNAQEVINRYVYDVVRRLPAKQQPDIESELRTLIEDMLDAHDPDGQRKQEYVESVLYELGKPSLMATRYRGEPRYLIGPEIYDEYWMLMKLVIPIVMIVVLVTGVFGLLFQGITFASVASLFGNMIGAGIQAAAGVTFTLAITSYFTTKKDKVETWSIDDLEEVPDTSLVIKKSEPIVSIIFLLIGLTIWVFFADKIGIYLYQTQMKIIPAFAEGILARYGFLIVLVLLTEIAVELLRFLEGRWTLRLTLIHAVANTITAILSLWFVNLDSLFHPEFISFLNQMFANIDFPLNVSLPSLLTVVILLVYIGENGALAYRFWRSRRSLMK